ncbi:nuclear transport factor 2 family protein [Ensifer sp. ENS05]|uniref:YybH family protein n=1 Tax=Ensifer sp. ENS05 TaxID=2769277 RepID=UPI00177F1617|nr:nuclear transport factor 2 family protein [Ensifer sp. ENS05]MBD9597376.1 nuclear transport factor 2 family protein [Ensifer sp. ENS05]
MKINQLRRWHIVVATSAVILSATTSFADTNVSGVTVHSGPSEASQAWQKAVEASDAAALTRMHSTGTIAYGVDTQVTKGVEAIMGGYAAMFERFSAKVELRDAGWVREGALLNSWGQFTLTLTPRAGGDPIRVDGRFSDLAVWTDGHWQYVMDHASVPSH